MVLVGAKDFNKKWMSMREEWGKKNEYNSLYMCIKLPKNM